MNSLKLILLVIVASIGVICLAQQPPCSCTSAACNTILAVDATGINKETTDKAVNAKLPKLLDLGAKKCVPCKMMAPILEQVNARLQGRLQVVKIDTDKYPQLASQYQIEALPTLVLFKNGQPVERIEGVMQAPQLIAQLEKLLGN
ncbi:MAG: thioredoxin fold domain-containing protein [Chloroflexaceae bacterium]|nr:thioredoxin fold domain-containing protein [Chloroflexaceae bacterium]